MTTNPEAFPRLLNLVIDAFVAAYLKGSEEDSGSQVRIWSS